MKLSQVLSQVNQVEKSKFINVLDKICSSKVGEDTRLAQDLSRIDGHLRSASGSEINQLFTSCERHFADFLRSELALTGSQISLLVKILSRDGNCVARVSWIEKLYAREYARIDTLSEELKKEIEASEELSDYGRGVRLSIYKDCFDAAYHNDLRLNREAKISDDERSVLNVLAARMGLTADEVFAIEHMVVKIPKVNIDDSLNALRELGVLFVDRRRMEVLVADEVVEILNKIQGVELTDKHVLRVLRSLSDPELSLVVRKHGFKARGTTRQEKIQLISLSGVPIRSVLSKDIFSDDAPLNKRKERLKTLMDGLELDYSRSGTTLNDRIDILIESLKSGFERECNALSASGYKDLLGVLSETEPSMAARLREDFEIEEVEKINPERLKQLSISPLDILFCYSNDEVKRIRDNLNISKRGSARSLILEAFASSNDKLLEHYELLATRDWSGLKERSIDIREPEIGIKFEEATRTMLEHLGLTVDEDLRKKLNTSKDQIDIIVSISDDDIIIGEAKSFKNGEFGKYSSTSRQVKSYVAQCEAAGKRVAQVLIVAPSFSQDFIESAEMDTDINISLLEAGGLKKIVDTYKSKKNPRFSEKLLTKGGLLKSDLIAKTI
ncbi:hypothetical protein [Pseudoteredinibacter isoporae]|uniref:Uncharacterized protein n=1 Tax=Pseudoteredinibacter isoporae TaxID=570281 RepID=A0A7X0MXC8_9GAMM|nr:hypothetical protein [Pseudoteredinibacter isoporae]MBB6521914.1 hypothetical protein [Pseudoteredinibacter isoporae]NHO87455.1 hypothetical protein [Pseudoteredinibacter isoporae]NIB24214.1 hypothetical protein [Pseudoteredinibacter isoporae]